MELTKVLIYPISGIWIYAEIVSKIEMFSFNSIRRIRIVTKKWEKSRKVPAKKVRAQKISKQVWKFSAFLEIKAEENLILDRIKNSKQPASNISG